MAEKVCKCGDKRCIGFLLLHERDLENLDKIKDFEKKEHGDVPFKLEDSPSSGEIFTKFYELHVLKE